MTGVLDGKVAIVTGASRGIGRGIALAYAQEGASVVAVARGQQGVDAVVAEIEARGGKALGIACNVADREAIYGAVARTADWHGRIDILVNNAQGCGSAANPAGSTVLRPLEELPEEEWDYNLVTGATGTLRFMQAAFPYLKASGAGRVINFGSMWGQLGYEGAAAYNATKEAIRALSRTAAREWGKHAITVNVINPVIYTDLMANYEKVAPEAVATMIEQIPMRRVGDPLRDAGRVAVFIAGPDAAYLTGMTFQVDGGFFLSP